MLSKILYWLGIHKWADTTIGFQVNPEDKRHLVFCLDCGCCRFVTSEIFYGPKVLKKPPFVFNVGGDITD